MAERDAYPRPRTQMQNNEGLDSIEAEINFYNMINQMEYAEDEGSQAMGQQRAEYQEFTDQPLDQSHGYFKLTDQLNLSQLLKQHRGDVPEGSLSNLPK